jgi:hypothetical protein
MNTTRFLTEATLLAWLLCQQPQQETTQERSRASSDRRQPPKWPVFTNQASEPTIPVDCDGCSTGGERPSAGVTVNPLA